MGLPSTPWQERRFDAHPQQSQVLLGQTYEDSDIERNAFPADGRIFCIAARLDVLPPHFGPVLRGRMLRCFSRHANASNPYAHELLLGDSEARDRGPISAAEARRIHLVLAGEASYLAAAAWSGS